MKDEKPKIECWRLILTTVDGCQIELPGDSIPEDASKDIDEAIKREGYPVEWEDF